MLVWGHGPAREQPLDCWQVETPRPLQGRANGCLRENRYERQLFRSARNGDAAVTPHRALVVEHDPEVIDVISEALESLEHTFDTACSQREAVKRLRETSYSYVLLDIDIPARSRTGAPRIQNTENLLEKITELKNGDSPPVIILSDYEANGLDATENVMRLAMSLSDKGASDIIKKPFATAGRTLDRVIKKVLGMPMRTRKSRGRAATADVAVTPSGAKPEPPSQQDQSERWPDVPNDPVTLDEFMAKSCEPRSKENRKFRKRALLAAARHGTVALPPLAASRKQGQANKYFVHDLLAAWQGFIDEGVDLPPLLAR